MNDVTLMRCVDNQLTYCCEDVDTWQTYVFIGFCLCNEICVSFPFLWAVSQASM